MISPEQIVDFLSPHIKDERKSKIQDVVESRILSVVPILEDIYDRGNVSAVMRTAEGLGFSRFDIIQTHSNFKQSNRVTQGADKWLDIKKWNSTEDCFENLKSKGFKVYVTSLEGARPMDEINFSSPSAILFGNEKNGASQKALEMADEKIIIPMPGFTQSFNISVAAALTLDRITHMKNIFNKKDELLTDKEKVNLLSCYYQKTVGRSDEIIKRKLEEGSKNYG